MQHTWVPSTLGHGQTMCSRCFVTNLEAAAIGMTECDPPTPAPANSNERQWTQDEIDVEIDEDRDEEDEAEWWAVMQCSRDRRGHCGQAGSEYCEFECPFNR